MKVVAGQLRVYPGEPERMLEQMLCKIAEARQAGADAIFFPELVWGYLLGDLWEQESWLRRITALDVRIRGASHDISVFWGSVVTDWSKRGEDGRVRKYNAVLCARDGSWVDNGGPLTYWVPKTNDPTYRIFDDSRHFFMAPQLAHELDVPLEEILRPFSVPCSDGTCVRVGAMVCEDGWDDDYTHKPASLYRGRADVLVNLSHSPYTYEKRGARERMLARRAGDSNLPILYVASVGLEDNGKNLVLFDGGSCLMGADGEVKWRARDHEESFMLLDPFRTHADTTNVPGTGVAEVYEAIIAAMRITLAPFPKIVIGLSGGIDSALSAALVVEAVGADRVVAVNMPSRHNSRTTKRLARRCAQRLGIEYHVVPITWLFAVACRVLRRFGLTGLTLENMQALLRMFIQNTIAQALGGVFLSNGNDTENALGYFTLNGDGRGAYAFLGNVPKGWVYELARYANRHEERIPQGILTIRPSAELSPEQNPEEGKGDPIFYPYHDALVRAWREGRKDPEWVLEHLLAGDFEQVLGIEAGTIASYFPNVTAFVENLEWCWRMFTGSVFKRVQAPPILILFRRAFGFDLRESMTAAPREPSETYRALRERALAERTLW